MNLDIESIKPDAVIVLANQMDINGILNNESKARAVMAVKIFNEKSAKCLVTCGWAYRDDTNIKIADAFKSFIVDELGISSDQVVTELSSRDTVGDAFFTKINLALSSSWKRICIVTSNYHVARTQEIFNFIYGNDYLIDVIGTAVSTDNTVLSNEISSTEAFRDTFSDVEMGNDGQVLERLRERHPFYNGEIYKQI